MSLLGKSLALSDRVVIRSRNVHNQDLFARGGKNIKLMQFMPLAIHHLPQILTRYKSACICERGDPQTEGVVYLEIWFIFSLTERDQTGPIVWDIRVLTYTVVLNPLPIHQILQISQKMFL